MVLFVPSQTPPTVGTFVLVQLFPLKLQLPKLLDGMVWFVLEYGCLNRYWFCSCGRATTEYSYKSKFAFIHVFPTAE